MLEYRAEMHINIGWEMHWRFLDHAGTVLQGTFCKIEMPLEVCTPEASAGLWVMMTDCFNPALFPSKIERGLCWSFIHRESLSLGKSILSCFSSDMRFECIFWHMGTVKDPANEDGNWLGQPSSEPFYNALRSPVEGTEAPRSFQQTWYGLQRSETTSWELWDLSLPLCPYRLLRKQWCSPICGLPRSWKVGSPTWDLRIYLIFLKWYLTGADFWWFNRLVSVTCQLSYYYSININCAVRMVLSRIPS